MKQGRYIKKDIYRIKTKMGTNLKFDIFKQKQETKIEKQVINLYTPKGDYQQK